MVWCRSSRLNPVDSASVSGGTLKTTPDNESERAQWLPLRQIYDEVTANADVAKSGKLQHKYRKRWELAGIFSCVFEDRRRDEAPVLRRGVPVVEG